MARIGDHGWRAMMVGSGYPNPADAKGPEFGVIRARRAMHFQGAV